MSSFLGAGVPTHIELGDYKDSIISYINTKCRNLEDLAEYVNNLAYEIFRPFEFFNREVAEPDDDKYYEFRTQLINLYEKYIGSSTPFNPIPIIMLLCGFQPHIMTPTFQAANLYSVQSRPDYHYENHTSREHKDDFKQLQEIGLDFLKRLLEYKEFNTYLGTLFLPVRIITLSLAGSNVSGIHGDKMNYRFNSVITGFFITDEEFKNPKFSDTENAVYMTVLKIKHTLDALGIDYRKFIVKYHPDLSGGRRTSRRKQTKSRNPRKRKSTTKQRRRKSVKHRKS